MSSTQNESSPTTDPATTNPPTDPATTNPSTDPNPPTDPATTTPSTDPATTNPPTDPATTTPSTDPATTNPPTDPATITDSDPPATPTDPTDDTSPPLDPIDPPGDDELSLDDPGDLGPFVPPTAPISTQYGITFYWNPDTEAFVFEGVKDLDALALALGAAKLYYNIQQNWTGNQMALVPVSQDMFSLTVGMTNAFTNPDPPPVFGNNFHTAFVNNSVNISSGTSYVSAPTLTLDIAKPGLYAVFWYVEILIPEGSVEVLVLANGADKLSDTTYGQSSDGNDWRTISGFAVQAFPAGTPGLKLAYKYVDPDGQQATAAPGSAATARNAKLMVYQVGRV